MLGDAAGMLGPGTAWDAGGTTQDRGTTRAWAHLDGLAHGGELAGRLVSPESVLREPVDETRAASLKVDCPG